MDARGDQQWKRRYIAVHGREHVLPAARGAVNWVLIIGGWQSCQGLIEPALSHQSVLPTKDERQFRKNVTQYAESFEFLRELF